MARFRTALIVTLTAAAVLPAAAVARPRAQVLRDVAPLGGGSFKDRVFSSDPRKAHVSEISGKWYSYPLQEGGTISAAISARYADTLNTHVAQSYVDFLDSLDHGPELAQLRVYIAPPDEVLRECGGQEGTLACYDASTQIMV